MATMTPEIRKAVHDARNWTLTSQAGYAATPYVDALLEVSDGATSYYEDSLDQLIIRLVGNLSGWRGETAREAKKVLRNA